MASMTHYPFPFSRQFALSLLTLSAVSLGSLSATAQSSGGRLLSTTSVRQMTSISAISMVPVSSTSLLPVCAGWRCCSGTAMAPLEFLHCSPSDPTVADLNNDGTHDIAATRSDSTAISTWEESGPLAVADFNRDGFRD